MHTSVFRDIDRAIRKAASALREFAKSVRSLRKED